MEITKKKKITKVQLTDFNIGRVYQYYWNQTIILFDLERLEILQLSHALEIIQKINLKDLFDIKQIDGIFFSENILIIADSLKHALFKSKIEVRNQINISITQSEEYSLPVGSFITSIVAIENEYFLLDKDHSMLRVFDTHFTETRTIGSRLGYIMGYDVSEKQRLGFELPEDMMILGQQIIISDSGNKRLVIITPEGKLKKTITLPEFPFKILHCSEDLIIISDFDCSLMLVSLTYGFIHKISLDFPVDFFSASFNKDQSQIILVTENNELVEFSLKNIPIEVIAEHAKNWKVLMNINLHTQDIPAARKILNSHPELILDYAKNIHDDQIENQLKEYVHQNTQSFFDGNEKTMEEVLKLSLEFIKIYKSIPSAEDKEAANINKENINKKIFHNIKEYRSNLRAIIHLNQSIVLYSSSTKLMNGLLEKRFLFAKESLIKSIEELKHHLDPYNENELIRAIVFFWFFSEEIQIFFKDKEFKYERIIGDKFLLAFLNDFYFNIAELYFYHNNINQYISFCDRELTMFPDKINIAKIFIEQLIALKFFDGALRMLKKFPDQNKENVNFLYFRFYKEQGEMKKAFLHLNKEIQLHSHRFDLIPLLLNLNQLNQEESRQYIERIIEKSGKFIDSYLNIAKAFQENGDYEKAMEFINKELEYYPENQLAITFKLNLLLNADNNAELMKLASKISLLNPPLLKSQLYYKVENYQQSWYYFKEFISKLKEESTAYINLYLIGSLNYLTLDDQELIWLQKFMKNTRLYKLKREIAVYFSLRQYMKNDSVDSVEGEFSIEDYLSSYSTNQMAYQYFTSQLPAIQESQTPDKLLAIIEKILTYHPGDKQIYKFLDDLPIPT